MVSGFFLGWLLGVWKLLPFLAWLENLILLHMESVCSFLPASAPLGWLGQLAVGGSTAFGVTLPHPGTEHFSSISSISAFLCRVQFQEGSLPHLTVLPVCRALAGVSVLLKEGDWRLSCGPRPVSFQGHHSCGRCWRLCKWCRETLNVGLEELTLSSSTEVP